MEWQTKSGIVIMLTTFHEKEVVKCGIYFPREIGEVKDVGAWGTVECISRVKECGTDVRQLRVLKCCENNFKEERMVWHFHFLAWPDNDVPKMEEDVLALLALIKMTRFQIENQRISVKFGRPDSVLPPRIVHCSAGIGRTGTLIALDYLLKQLQDDVWVAISEEADPIF